jgi:hypothetical protein
MPTGYHGRCAPCFDARAGARNAACARCAARAAHFLEQKTLAAAPGPQKNGQRAELSRAARGSNAVPLPASPR